MGPLALGLIAGGGLLGGSLLGNALDKSGGVKDYTTDTKRWAEDMLSKFATTGKLGNYQVAEKYNDPLGNYDKSNTENLAQSKLLGLLSSADPAMLDFADSQIKSLGNLDQYDPRNETGIFDAFKGTVQRQTQEGMDNIKRNAAFGGSLYSTDTIKNLSNYQAKSNESLTSKLAELYDSFVNRKISTTLSSIPLALQSGTAREGINSSRIGTAFQYGGLDRSLADTKAQREYQAWLNQRSEYPQMLSALSSLTGSTADLASTPSKWSSLLNSLAGAGGMVTGMGIGKG